jgi:intraflagellar transport protein 140
MHLQYLLPGCVADGPLWWFSMRSYGMYQELLSLALKSPPAVMLEAADHLLAAGNAEAAALLYQKGGKLGKALEMALGCGLYGALDSIAEALDKDQDPMLMAR